MPVSVSIKGLPELLRKLDSSLFAVPLHNFFERATLAVQGRARRIAPVSEGRLRNSIFNEVDTRPVPEFGKVGFLSASEASDLWFAARAMEYGTGSQGDKDVSHTARHFPPGGALDTWAKRHGFPNGWVVAKAIGRRGGLKPRRMLRDGLREAMGEIQSAVDRLGGEILARWKG